MAVMGEQQGDAVAPEAVTQLFDAASCSAQVAAHQGGGDEALGATGEDGAAVEVGGVDGRRLALGQEGGRGQARPSLRERTGGGPERGGPLRGRQGGPAPARGAADGGGAVATPGIPRSSPARRSRGCPLTPASWAALIARESCR